MKTISTRVGLNFVSILNLILKLKTEDGSVEDKVPDLSRNHLVLDVWLLRKFLWVGGRTESSNSKSKPLGLTWIVTTTLN